MCSTDVRSTVAVALMATIALAAMNLVAPSPRPAVLRAQSNEGFTFVKLASLPGTFRGIASADDQLLLACNAAGLWLYDVSDPNLPVVVGTDPGSCGDPIGADGRLALVARSGVDIVDLSDPRHPIRTARILNGADVNTISVADGLAALGTRDAVYFVDVRDPLRPTESFRSEVLGDSAAEVTGASLGNDQDETPTLTTTPTPEMLSDVAVSGVVESQGTPVRARVHLYPSDGRCPWSGGYRSDADGRFDRTCSDARLGSRITVRLLADGYDQWSDSYTVEQDELGARPIDVRAELTPQPTRPGPTPSATPMDDLSLTIFSGVVRGIAQRPVPWAAVTFQGARCLSPVNTDDDGRFEVWCFGGHSLWTQWQVAVRAKGYRPWDASFRMPEHPLPYEMIDLVPVASAYVPWAQAATSGSSQEPSCADGYEPDDS